MYRVDGARLLGCLFLVMLVSAPASAQISLAGEWAGRYHEDQGDRVPGDVQGDFTGVPMNDAARRYAESFDVTRVALLEHQCQPYNAPHIYRGPLQFRIWEEKVRPHRKSSPTRNTWAPTCSTGRSGWTAVRILQSMRPTRSWAFQQDNGTGTFLPSQPPTSKKNSIGAAAFRAAT